MKPESNDQHSDGRDSGYTLIEMIIVVLILGILSSAAVMVLTGISTEASATGCQADSHQLQTAAEAYFAQRAADVPDADAERDDADEQAAEEAFADAAEHHTTFGQHECSSIDMRVKSPFRAAGDGS